MKKGRAAATAAAVTFILLLVPTAPASAANPTTTIGSPGSGATVATAAVPITGSTSIPPGILGASITGVSVTVAAAGTTVASCSDDGCGATLGGTSTSFSYRPVLSYNGPYTATANVTANENGLLGATPRADSAGVGFKVAVPPGVPQGVAARANADRSVTVSWTRNPEPDLFGYQVQRQAPGSTQFTKASSFLPQPGASPVTWTDQMPAQAGGTFRYVVFAVRPNGDGGSANPLSSTSGVTSVDVPAPAPVPTTPPPAGVPPATLPAPIPLPATPSASATPTLDLSNFLSNAAAAGKLAKVAIPAVVPTLGSKLALPKSGPSQLSLPASPGPPDTGFGMTLPFTQPPQVAVGNGGGGGGGGQLALGSPPASGSHQRSLLVTLAAGLFLCVAGLHLRFFNRNFGTGSLEPLVPVADGGDPTGEIGVIPAAGGAVGSPVGRRVAAWATSVRSTAVPWGVERVSDLARSVGLKADPDSGVHAHGSAVPARPTLTSAVGGKSSPARPRPAPGGSVPVRAPRRVPGRAAATESTNRRVPPAPATAPKAVPVGARRAIPRASRRQVTPGTSPEE